MGGEGVRNYMNVLQLSTGSDIMYAFGNEPWTNQNYIDALFEKLPVYLKFTVDTAWSLTVPVLDRITSDLSVPNVGVGKGMKEDKASICFVDKLSDPGCRSNLSRFERRIQNLFNFLRRTRDSRR